MLCARAISQRKDDVDGDERTRQQKNIYNKMTRTKKQHRTKMNNFQIYSSNEISSFIAKLNFEIIINGKKLGILKFSDIIKSKWNKHTILFS